MDAAEIMTPVSLRRAALVWMTILLTVVGVLSSLIAFLYARSEATEFLDGQLRQIALNAGDGVRPIDAPAAADQDPEDQFSVTVWGADGRVLRASLPEHPDRASKSARLYECDGRRRIVAGLHDGRCRPGCASRHARHRARGNRNKRSAGRGGAILIIIPLSWLVVRSAMIDLLEGLTPWQMTSRLAAPRRRRRFRPLEFPRK